MGAFLVSFIAGVVWPLLPILAEYGLTNGVQPANLAITAVVYAAAIGLVSRNQAVVFSALVCATVCAMVYGAYEMDIQHVRPESFFNLYGSVIARGTIYFYAMCYLVERFARHVLDRKPFVEFHA
jgi:hypothetical protein